MTKTFELTISKIEELPSKLSKIPPQACLHLPDKPNIYPNLELANHLSNRNLGITYSIGNHYHGGNLDLILKDLSRYLEIIQASPNITELLIVSGPTAKKIDTLDILSYLSNSEIKAEIKPELRISIAYNCNSGDQTRENQRLIKKLEFPVVTKVYIQITDDYDKIVAAIKLIQSLDSKVEICVCIFEPTKSSLAKFIFRPWKGVALSDKFLSNFETAGKVNKHNIQLLESFEVEYIITT